MEIYEILKSFEIYDGKYKRKEIDEALIKRKEITPHLIAVLENVLQSPKQYAAPDSDYWGHIHAFILLGHFGETKAHDIIVDLFSLPNNLPSELFGELVTEILPDVLLRTCGGNTERIKELVLNENAYDYCRGAALEALSYAMIEGYITREKILSFYRELFTDSIASPQSAFHDMLANCVCDIYPEELMDTIERAYDEGLIHPGYIGHEDFIKTLQSGKEECLKKFRDKIETRQLSNIHDRISWWACFNQPKKSPSRTRSANSLKLKSKKMKKSKRKQAKASKRANRKRKK